MQSFPLFFCLILVSALGISCANEKTENNQNDEIPMNEPVIAEDFYEFYRNFHRDEQYQIDHIIFPLKGLPNGASADQIQADNFSWQKEDWVVQKSMDFETSEFKRRFVPYGQIMVEENITHKNKPLGMQRKYAKIGEEWFLIYYAGLNPIK